MFRLEVDAAPPSLNKFYSGMFWATRKAIADTWHSLFRAAFIDAKLPKKLNTPLTMSVTRFCKGRLVDTDNAVVIAKMCGDSLKMYGYIPDDSPEYIPTVILSSKKGEKDKIVVILE